MKYLIPFLLLLAVGCVKTTPVQAPTPPPITSPVNRDFTITNTWNYDFTNFVACSQTVTKGCISGFQWGYLIGPTPTVLDTTSTSVCTGTTQPLTCKDVVNSTLPVAPNGLNTFTAATYIDINGNKGSTADDTFTLPMTINAPTNSVVTAQ